MAETHTTRLLRYSIRRGIHPRFIAVKYDKPIGSYVNVFNINSVNTDRFETYTDIIRDYFEGMLEYLLVNIKDDTDMFCAFYFYLVKYTGDNAPLIYRAQNLSSESEKKKPSNILRKCKKWEESKIHYDEVVKILNEYIYVVIDEISYISAGVLTDLEIIYLVYQALEDIDVNMFFEQLLYYYPELDVYKDVKTSDGKIDIFIAKYDAWRKTMDTDVAKIRTDLRGYLRTIDEVEKTDRKIAITFGRTKIKNISLVYHYKGKLTLKDIFERIVLTHEVPYAQHNRDVLNMRTVYKIHKGNKFEDAPNYSKIIVPASKKRKVNVLYINVLNETKLKEGASYSLCTISKSMGIIEFSIKTTHKEEQVVLMRLHESIGIPIPDRKMVRSESIDGDLSLTGEFNVYRVNIHTSVFLALITEYSPLFYIDEKMPFYTKNKLDIFFSVPTMIDKELFFVPGVKFTLTQYKIREGDIITDISGERKAQFDKDIIAINVNFRALNMIVLAQFKCIFLQLMNTDSKRIEEYYTWILKYVPEYSKCAERDNEILGDKGKLTTSKELHATAEYLIDGTKLSGEIEGKETTFLDRFIKSKRIKSLNDRIKDHTGDLLKGTKFARKCQKKSQPLLIDESEIGLWQSVRNILINGKGVRTRIAGPRHILKLDGKNKSYYFVCPTDEQPYIAARWVSVEGKTQNIPIPCCYVKAPVCKRGDDHKNIHTIECFSKKEKKTNSTYVHSGDQVMPAGSHGRINSMFAEFISSNYSVVEELSIRRYAVFENENSFIHCVLEAFDDKYNDLNTEEDKIKYAINLRRNLFTHVNKEIVRQEFYDYSDSDLKRLLDSNKFFDPILWYRAFESIYDCNIYVVIKVGEKNNVISMMIPRNKLFHISHPNLNRENIIILRHMGGGSDILKYPQCDLVIGCKDESCENKNIRKFFRRELSEELYRAKMFVDRTIFWDVKEDQVRTKVNKYSVYNYESFLGKAIGKYGEIRVPSITGQYLDSYGKARLFEVVVEIDPKTNQFVDFVYVEVPPAQPLNAKEINISKMRENFPRFDLIIDMFGDPTRITTDSKNITGLWFDFAGDILGLYCPCKRENLSLFRGGGYNTEIEMSGKELPIYRDPKTSAMNKFKSLERSAKYLKQIFKYLYLAYKIENIDNFMKTVSEVKEMKDTAKFYDVSGLKMFLPSYTNPRSILTDLSKNVKFIDEKKGKIILPSEHVRRSIVYTLEKFRDAVYNYGKFDSSSDYRELLDYYTSGRNFYRDHKYKDTEYIITSASDYKEWKEMFVPEVSLIKRLLRKIDEGIQIRLSSKFKRYLGHYIYQYSDSITRSGNNNVSTDAFYIVQNVAGGHIRGAINCSRVWTETRRNPGFNISEYKGKLPPYIEYKITAEGKIEIRYVHSSSDQYLEILWYGGNEYAALLPF